MKKEEILKRKGIKVRKVTAKDKSVARTTYQRNANFIITTSNKTQYFSTNGSLQDCLNCERLSKKTNKEIA